MLIKDLSENRTTPGIRVHERAEDMMQFGIGPLLLSAILLIISFVILMYFDSGPMLVLGLFMSISGTASLILFFESRKYRRAFRP